jgi:uncharacterized repeat protein (TIGR02543 family)
MKKHILPTILFALVCMLPQAQALDWQDYDDFGDNSLDLSKWEVGYFAGGQDPVVANGRAELKGASYTGSNPTKLPQDLLPAAQGSTEGNAFLFAQQEGMLGIEAEITLPSSGNSLEAGVFISMFDSNPLGYDGIELAYRPTGTIISYDYLDAAGQETDGYKAAALDTKYRLAVVHSNGKTTFFLDGEKIQEFDQPFTPDYWGVGAFNDNGQPFTAYVDNVRVLTTATADTASYAPDSLIGQVVTHTSGSTVETLRFMDADTVLFYESAQDANPGQQQYTYTKTSGTTAQVTVIFDDGDHETTDYVFTGADTATYVWKELSGDMDTASGTAAFADAVEGTWLAYDDFNDGTLDTTKWGTMYMDGAAEPTITGGQVKFSSGVGNLSAPSKIKSGWESIFTADDGGQSYLYLNETEIYGIEAEVSLPSTLAKSTGFNVGIASKTPLSATAAELNNDNVTTAELAFWNLAADGEESRITETGSLGTKYRLAAVHADGKNTLYLDGEKQVEYPATNLVRELTYIGSFNDFSGGQPYTIYADNVKVLWKVEAPEESVGDSSAPAAVTATITAATSSSSQGSVAGGGTFTAGATASLTATATAGYIFSHWSGGYSGTENPLSLTVSADATATANFAQDGRDSDNDGLSNYDEIQRGTDPNDSDTDDDFLTDGLEVEMALNPSVANGNLQEIATAAQAALTNAREAGRQEVLNNPIAYGFVSGGAPATNATGNGETPMIEGWFYQEVSGWQYVSAQTYPYLYRASPSSWLYFQSGSSNPPLLYDFSEERWLTPPTSTHMVKVNANLTEAGSVSGGGTYEDGSSATLTATPANGYVFVAWSGDASGENASTTITVDGAKTVTAIFSKITAADVKEVLDDIFDGF